MTSDEIKKVREAAESSSYLPSACIMDYVPIMRNFIFSLVGTDGEDSVNEDWLREEWGAVGNHKGCEILIPEECINGFDWRLVATTAPSWKGSYWFLEREVNHVIRLPFANPTRYQFRLLAAALGIKRKKEKS